MKVCFETFGCRLNRAEALSQEAGFLARGWTATDSHAAADLIVVRGCSVTARAQHDCERMIAHLRAKYPTKRLVVTGCLNEKRNELLLRDLSKVAVPTRTARAYLKVQDGCSGACSFCIVPRFRGPAVSQDATGVLDSAKRFIEAGYREIVVTGCNLSSYSSQGLRLAGLVDRLATLDASCRVRVGSVEPGPAADEFVETMAANANICRYLHLPIQSGSNPVLSGMRRPYSVKTVEAVISKAVRLMPGVAIGCDLMTGFPGESEIDFLATQMLFKRFPIARAHIFPYSERPGTPAAFLPMVVPGEIRRARAQDLAARADAERKRFAKRFVGREVDVVIEDAASSAGWTGEYFWCRARHVLSEKFRPVRKSRVTFKVSSVEGHVLVGDIV